MRVNFLFSLFLVVLLVLGATATAESTETLTDDLAVELLSKPVTKWSVHDVELWMNYTIGYSEYSLYLRKNLIDGVTLLEMEPADFESYLPLQSPLHAIKIAAHLKQLKGLCRCYEDGEGEDAGPTDLWSYIKVHPRRSWILGTTASFFPRTAMVATFLFDHELYLDVVGRNRTTAEVLQGDVDQPARVVSKLQSCLYWLSVILCPDLYMAYQTGRFVPRNFIIMSIFVVHFLSRALGEYFLLFLLYNGQAFPPGKSLLSKVWMVYSYTLFAPLVGVVIGFCFPAFLANLCVVLLALHNMFFLVMSLFLGDTEVGQPFRDTVAEEEALMKAEAEDAQRQAAAEAQAPPAPDTAEKERLDKLD